MASIVSNTPSSSSKRTIEKVNGTMENGASKKSKLKATKVTKEELRATVKKFVAYYESMNYKSVEDESCDDKKELERRYQAISMLRILWHTPNSYACAPKYVHDKVTFTRKVIAEKCNLEGEVIDDLMEVAEGLEWIEEIYTHYENDDEMEFTIDFTTVFEALPGYLNLIPSKSNYLPSVKTFMDEVGSNFKKDNPFYKFLAAWDQEGFSQALNELVDFAVHYIALASGDIESGLIRALKDDKFKCGGGFTIVERDVIFYHAVEKYKVGAYHISAADYNNDDYNSDTDDEYDSQGEPIDEDEDDEENANLKERYAKLKERYAKLVKDLAETRETHAKLVKEYAKNEEQYEKDIAKMTREHEENIANLK